MFLYLISTRLCCSQALRREKEVDVPLGWVHHRQWLLVRQVVLYHSKLFFGDLWDSHLSSNIVSMMFGIKPRNFSGRSVAVSRLWWPRRVTRAVIGTASRWWTMPVRCQTTFIFVLTKTHSQWKRQIRNNDKQCYWGEICLLKLKLTMAPTWTLALTLILTLTFNSIMTLTLSLTMLIKGQNPHPWEVCCPDHTSLQSMLYFLHAIINEDFIMTIQILCNYIPF